MKDLAIKSHLQKDKFIKELYAINLPRFEKQISASYINARKLECKIIENGIILPLRKFHHSSHNDVFEGGVCDKDFEFIAGYKRRDNGVQNNLECIRSYTVNQEEIEQVNEKVIFGGIAYAHFGHFLVETLSRLWWIVEKGLYDAKVVFLKEKPFDASFTKLIELMGLRKENIIYLDHPTQFTNIYIPDQSLCYFEYFHQEYAYPYQAIMNNISPGKDKKIYLSRTQFRKKDTINEQYFEDFFCSLGFRVVYPEQLDIKEQISIVSGAKEIVSTIGTVSHLALFAQKGTKIVTLLRSRNYFNTTQAIVNQSKELQYTFVDVTCNFLPHRYSSNCYYIGPNITWNEFVNREYGIELNINLRDYLNSDKSHMGDYFKLWMSVFSSKSQLKKIRKDNSIDILNHLEVMFANEVNSFSLTTEKIAKDLVDKPKEVSQLTDKRFLFSRYDGTYARQIRLEKTGLIQTIEGKSHANESFWTIKDNELVFLNKTGEISSRYFCMKEKESGLFLLGFYEPNKELIFKLEELIDTVS